MVFPEEKIKLIEIGFFKELSYGFDYGPSLEESVSTDPPESLEKIITYIKNGVDIILIPLVAEDYFDDSVDIGAPHILTDGKYAWPATLVYYVEKYYVKLPEDFIEYMKKNNWKVPDENEIDLARLQFFEDGCEFM